MAVGTYARTPEIRAKNRANAHINGPCPDDCHCGKHRPRTAPWRTPCPAGCSCARHDRTPEHNARIGLAVALTAKAKR